MRKLNIAFSAAVDVARNLLKIDKEELVDEIFNNANLPNEISISLLCNPISDGNFEDTLDSYFHKKNVDIYLDSGGFQLIHGRLKGNKNDIKENVYRKMIKHADYAFCFDESPLEDNGKYYNHNKAVWAAKETNKNIRRQIEVFKENNAKAKILPIFQIKEEDREGAAHNLLDRLDFSCIGGVSLNSRTWGASETLNFAKLAFFKETLKEFKECPNFLHLLGYGELRTLSSIVAVQSLGYLGKGNTISADGSSYSLAMQRWGMVAKTNGSAKRVPASSNNGKDWYAFIDWCYSNLGEHVTDELKNIGYLNTKDIKKDMFVVQAAILMLARNGFIEFAKDPVGFSLKYNYLNEPQVKSIEIFARTNDFKDYEEWRKEYHEVWRNRRNDAKKISRSNLDAFF